MKIPEGIRDGYLLPPKTIAPVMAHPIFTQPMYGPLRDISSEFLCPNLELIPNNTVSLLKTNQRFIEAYMVGLNHEMACELLWREFPTDQRGSYFRQFWDVADVVIKSTSLSQSQSKNRCSTSTSFTNGIRRRSLANMRIERCPPNEGDSNLVLVVRGDVLKKYPTVVIYAQEARWNEISPGRFERVLDEGKPILHPSFKAEIEPDVRFLGFDLTDTQAKGSANPLDQNPGWFFVLQERPGEPRFGLDNRSPDTPATPTKWNDLAWEHLTGFDTLDVINLQDNAPVPFAMTDDPDNLFAWRRNAADMAYILYQVPVMVAFHAADMLPKSTP